LRWLPVENGDIQQGVSKQSTFIAKDVREIGALMANTEAFIGGDSGIILASIKSEYR
jgi:hypothetical protein